MNNLESVNFYRLLKSSSGLISFLCSPITHKFIRTCDKYKHLDELCTPVACETPTLVKISPNEMVTVTFCGSGHCPGSIMAFVEGSRGNLLFTGDFRLPLNCARRLPFLKFNRPITVDDKQPPKAETANKNATATSQTKDVHDLYVDMTFFKPAIRYIPTREQSVRVFIEFLKEQLGDELKQSKESTRQDANSGGNGFKNCVYLKTSARIGYEYVYQEINRATGFKVHVNELIYKVYEQLPELQSVLTLDPYETPVHACIYENRKRDLAKTDLMSSSLQNLSNSGASCKKKSYSASLCSLGSASSQVNLDYAKRLLLPCTMLDGNESLNRLAGSSKANAIKVILSAMWFTDTAGVDKMLIEYKPPLAELNTPAYRNYSRIYRLCYSFHSSFEEIVDFVETIKPQKLYSIALPEITTEQKISDYFYDSTGNFIGFHMGKLAQEEKRSLDKNNSQQSAVANAGCLVNSSKLTLRKRKSSLSIKSLKYSSSDCNLNSNTSSSCSSRSNSSDELCFDDDAADESFKKKKRHAKT
jgi:hypothetical protein